MPGSYGLTEQIYEKLLDNQGEFEKYKLRFEQNSDMSKKENKKILKNIEQSVQYISKCRELLKNMIVEHTKIEPGAGLLADVGKQAQKAIDFVTGREELIKSFNDTVDKCKTDPVLASSIERSLLLQEVIPAEEYSDISNIKTRVGQTEIKVTGQKSLEAASRYKGHKVCVLNYADPYTPGGAVAGGANGQEENLCRLSTLYPCLNAPVIRNGFYENHKISPSFMNTDDCIYTPDIVVFKEDRKGILPLAKNEWYKVDVVSCSAPDLRKQKADELEIQIVLRKRISRIFEIAASKGVEILILGAFGCGTFNNDPQLVADIMSEILGQFAGVFKVVEFAVFCPSWDKRNEQIFRKTLLL